MVFFVRRFCYFSFGVLGNFNSVLTIIFLRQVSISDHPKAIIQKLSDDIFNACSDRDPIDKYDIYQHLMSYWDEIMQDDVHIITADGWTQGNEVIRLQKTVKSGKKDIEGLQGLEGRLIPISLVVKTYFSEESSNIEKLKDELEQTRGDMESLKEEQEGEDGLLSEVIENDKITKDNLQKRIKEIKSSPEDVDELVILNQYFVLFEREIKIKKKIKDAEKDLESKVLAKYPVLTEEEVKTLVVERKWMDELLLRVTNEFDSLSQNLMGRIKELSERYAETLPAILDDVGELEKKVEGLLIKMGFNWKQLS